MVSPHQDLGRLNILFESLSDLGEANDIGSLILMLGPRLRWMVGFRQATIALGRQGDAVYWSMPGGGEVLERRDFRELPLAHRSLLDTVLARDRSASEGHPITALCHPLESRGTSLGAICFSSDLLPYSYRDTRFVHHLARALAGIIARIKQATIIENQRDEAERAHRALESAARAKDEFVAMLGHELRNPLAPIMTALHMLRLRLGGTGDKEISVIERQAAHLQRLVGDLLDISRITRGHINLKKECVRLDEVIGQAVETASPLLEQRRHRLTVRGDTDSVVINVDRSRFAQVVSNLLQNAAKYTEPGGDITVTTELEEREAVVRVRDNGTGISQEMLPRVFDLFSQEKRSIDRSEGGLGLGLAIVRNLVSLHHGSVSAHSTGLGHGCEFTVRLPLNGLPSQSPAALSAHRQEDNRRRILVVDDNQDAAEALSDALKGFGYSVRVAHDGPEALQVADEFRPEAALLDIGLPVMDGHELGRRLRTSATSALPLVAITGYEQESACAASTAAGFSAHLIKPIAVGRLVTLLRDLM